MRRPIAWTLLLTFSCQIIEIDPDSLSQFGKTLSRFLETPAYADQLDPPVVTSPEYSDFVWTAHHRHRNSKSGFSLFPLVQLTQSDPPACHNIRSENRSGVNRWEQVTPGGVNLSNGDFTLSHRDLVIPERGLSLEITRTYNSQPTFELSGWTHEPDRGGSSWFIDQNSLRGEGDRIITQQVFQNPTTIQVRVQTAQAQPGEADVADPSNPDLPGPPSSWYVAWVNFAYQDYKNFYYFLLHRNGTLELSKLINGSLVTLQTKTSSLSPFMWHAVKIDVNGSTIRCWVDGVLQLQATEGAAIPAGKVGLNAYWCHALFDDVAINDSQQTLTDDFNRTSRQENEIFGWGWTWNFGLGIENNQLVTAKVLRSDGGQYGFTSSTSGQPYTPPPGCYGQLVKEPDGSFQYREKSGLLQVFNPQGQLIRMIDLNGNTIQISYDGQGRPVTVTGSTGLMLTLAYGSNGKVAAVTDPQGRVIHYGYDSAGHLVSVTDPLGGVVRYSYYPSHSMQGWSDKMGHATTNRYWYNNRVGSQTDPLGKTIHFEYWWDNSIVVNGRGERWTYYWLQDQWDKPTRVVDPYGNTEGYAWDSQGNRIGVTNRNGHLTAFEYDSRGNVTRVIRYRLDQAIIADTRMTYDPTFNQVVRTLDANGNVTLFDYDANWNLIRTTRLFGSASIVTEMTYDPTGLLLSTKDPLGNVTRYGYDAHGHRTAVVDSLGNQTTFTYDAIGRLLTTADPLGRTITNSYDASGNVLSVTNALGQALTSTYDADGRVLTMTDPNGQVTRSDYDAMGHVTRVTDPLGAVTMTAYDSTNFLHLGSAPKISETDPLGNTTTITYDAYDRPVSVTDPLGNTSTTTYDVGGNVVRQTDPLGHTTSYTYDPLSRRLTMTDPLGKVTQATYDAVGNMTSVTDANGNVTGYQYDALNRRVAVVEATGAKTTYAYDSLNQLLSVTDPVGNVTQMAYDALGRKTAMDDPDMGHWSYAYDAVGNLTTQIDAKGQILTFRYDVLNRLIQKQGQTSSTSTAVTLASYTYDDTSKTFCIGRLSKVVDNSGSADFWYDAVGHEVKTVKTIAGDAFTLQRVYDLKGQLTKLTYPDGEIVQYSYDADGHPTRVEGAQVYLGQATYTTSSQLAQVTYGNNVLTDYTYDAAGQITRLLTAKGTLQDLAYSFDPVGNVLSITDRVGTATQSFTYDSLNRLTQAVGASYGTHVYQYDSIGNILQKDGVTYNYGQNGSKPHAVTSGSDGSRFVYDADGNMVARSGQALTYDLENHLSQVNGPTRIYTAVASGGSMTSTYRLWAAAGEPVVGSPSGTTTQAALGFLASLGEPPVSPPGRTTRFIYDYQGQRVQKLSPESTTAYIGSLYEVTNSVVTKHIWFGINRIASVTGTEVLFYHADHLGSSNVITDKSGQLVQHLEYLPFGQVTVNQGSKNVAYKFTGKPLDDETGLIYFGARYYDSAIGRWTTADPTIENPFNPQTLNRYTYVQNNPLKYTDPTGQKSFWKKFKQFLGKVVGAVAAAVTFAVTGGNVAAAYAVFTLVDSVTTAAVNGGDIGRALAGAITSVALNFALPGTGTAATMTQFFLNAGIDAVRQAGISAVTAAITGGDPARAALGGLVYSVANVVPYVGTIVGSGAASEVQGGKFATGAIGTGIGIGTFAGASTVLSWLARSGNLQGAVDNTTLAASRQRQWQINEIPEGRAELGNRLAGLEIGARAGLGVDLAPTPIGENVKLNFNNPWAQMAREFGQAVIKETGSKVADVVLKSLRLPGPARTGFGAGADVLTDDGNLSSNDVVTDNR